MKKIGIVTITGKINFGNRLQNYALQEFLKKTSNYEVETILNTAPSNSKKVNVVNLLKLIKLATYSYFKENNFKRRNLFNEFDKNIKYSNKKFFFNKNKFIYDYMIVGSDQVWNPTYRLSNFDLCDFENNNARRISYAASLGVDKIPDSIDLNYVKNELNKFYAISVREEKGKELLSSITTKNIEVLIDPTMLLTKDEWKKVEKKPKQLKSKKYILNYFLGELSQERKDEINRIAKENDCDIINILDKNDPLYESGPSEFLYLEKNAFLICTDSFHSSVFAIIYDRPFIVFKREQKNSGNMFSRIDTLLKTFKIENRVFNNCITEDNLNHDYTKAYTILGREREKSEKFLKDSLEIK